MSSSRFAAMPVTPRSATVEPGFPVKSSEAVNRVNCPPSAASSSCHGPASSGGSSIGTINQSAAAEAQFPVRSFSSIVGPCLASKWG